LDDAQLPDVGRTLVPALSHALSRVQPLKIALLYNDDFSIYHFRRDLIRALIDRGYETCVIVPPGDYNWRIEALGARCIPLAMKRFLSPMSDLMLIWMYYRLFRREQFNIVHTMTIKPNIFGGLAARAAGVQRIVSLISGLGFVFTDGSGSLTRSLRPLILQLYRLALSMSYRIWFQNPDDFAWCIRRGLVKPEKGVVIISGGINTEEFSASAVTSQDLQRTRAELGIPVSGKCVLMVTARRVRSKGIMEFKEAARILRKHFPQWFFVMVCPKDPGTPDALSGAELENNAPDNLRIIGEFRSDVINLMALADIVALPSYYAEGVPRTLLEGLAMGRPIVTTDHPGCRETVQEDVNGFLVPVKDGCALARRLEILMSDPEKRHTFGEASRRMAEQKFSHAIIVERIIRDVYGLNQSGSGI
jgi:N,N'-diacetylbacillosaminyl-diphospho-undecaprenol alpha-1,3-N-acetylgalactosaminyltransferase